MHPLIEFAIAFLLISGGAFALVGSLGLARFSDFYMRVHGPTKTTTLGVGSLLLASAVWFSSTRPGISVHEILVALFLFATAPVSAHLLIRAAMAQERRRATGENGNRRNAAASEKVKSE